ncbi:MAG: ankyrin repeat domain-containing protein [Thiomicrorhabdus sp.]|nr:ankyrin repeat domain-containing protein [Thiomicrorhabdus sp.]
MQFNIKSKWLLAFGVIFTAFATLVGCKGGIMMDANKVFENEGEIQLAKAVQKGDVKKIKALITEGVNPNAKTIDDNRYPLLIWALLSQSKKGIVALLEAGADPAIGDSENYTVLHWAASANDPSYLTLLLEHGVDPNLKGKSGASAIRDAIMGDREENIRALLAAGANPNARSRPFKDGRPGDSVLHNAASAATAREVLILLEAGADPMALNAHGNTFQRSFFRMSEDIMTEEGKAGREKVRTWLREHNIPVEGGK